MGGPLCQQICCLEDAGGFRGDLYVLLEVQGEDSGEVCEQACDSQEVEGRCGNRPPRRFFAAIVHSVWPITVVDEVCEVTFDTVFLPADLTYMLVKDEGEGESISQNIR